MPDTGSFRILEGEKISMFLQSMVPKEVEVPAPSPAPAAIGEEDVQMGE